MDSMICGYGGVTTEEEVEESSRETLLLYRTESSASITRQKQLLNQIERTGRNPFLYPVPDEVGDRVHLYWVTELKEYLDQSREILETNVKRNWSDYHDNEAPIPDYILSSHILYTIDPAYNELSSFISKNDYRYFYLTEDLIRELVRQVLEGVITGTDSVEYMIRVLHAYPLRSISELYSSVDTSLYTRSALTAWLDRNQLDQDMELMRPEMLRSTLQRALLAKVLLRRLYPQEKLQEYDAALRTMLLTTTYSSGLLNELLTSRLRDRRYYDALAAELSSTISVVGERVKSNVSQFIRDVQLFTIPFMYDTGEVDQAIEFTDVSGRRVHKLVPRDRFPIIHNLLTNVFIPPPPTTDAVIQRLRRRVCTLLRKLCGRHRKQLLELDMGSFNRASGARAIFLPTESFTVRRIKPTLRCLPISPSRCGAEKRRRTSQSTATSFSNLLQLFVAAVNSVNKDELRRLYAQAYPYLTEQPPLLAYTSAYSQRITDWMLNTYLRKQIQLQLDSVWNSIEARLTADEQLTPVYTLLSLMLSPQFRTFLTDENQRIAQDAWDGLETTSHQFADSYDSCRPAPPITEKKRIWCVLRNSISLMHFSSPSLRRYHQKDITL